MNYAIILAGGVGSRFWPLSSSLEPKQFLSVCSNKSMMEETLRRISRLVQKENIYIAANRIHNNKIKNYIKNFKIPLKNVLFEPSGKNTLAPIAVLSKKIKDSDSEAVVAALPCDHYIKSQSRFLNLLNKAMNIAMEGHIVTLGISPDSPQTGYGYIKVKGVRKKVKDEKIKGYFKVERFIEKPNLKTAKRFLRDKRYYWNSGIFIFRPDVMLDEIKKFTPDAYKIISGINTKEDLNKLWHKLPSLSIDYAIMEKTKKLALLPADYGWIDLGSWRAIEELLKKDKDGNIFRGSCINIGSKNSTIWSDNRLVAVLGLDNVIIVDTKEGLLVCSRDKTQEVKKVVQILKQGRPL